MTSQEFPDHLGEQPLWFKVVDMLQHNWGVVIEDAAGVTIWFFGDTNGVFDKLHYPSRADAESALSANGFSLYDEDEDAKCFISRPSDTFHAREHPNGPIYSSGRYWKGT